MVVHSTKMLTSQISFDLKWGNMMIHLWSLGVSPYNFYIFLVFVTPQVKATYSSPAVQHRPLAGALPGDTLKIYGRSQDLQTRLYRMYPMT